MNNNMYQRQYIPNYNINQQSMNEQIDYQINQLQQMKEQMKNNAVQQPAINQTFQLAPSSNHGIRYVNTINDVDKEVIYFDTPFFSKDMSVVWIKNTKGEIKTYELNEIVPKDEKDLQIELLQAQIDELKGKIEYDANVRNVNEKQNATNTTTNDESIRTTVEKNESTSVQKISRGKTK